MLRVFFLHNVDSIPSFEDASSVDRLTNVKWNQIDWPKMETSDNEDPEEADVH